MTTAFIDYLERLRDREDRGALAALRRGLSGEQASMTRMHAHVVPFLPRDAPRLVEDAHYVVASLFALHSKPGASGRTLGACLADLAHQTGSASIEGRFVALLESSREDLLVHLRNAVALLKSKEIGVDYRQLLKDLIHWDHPSQFVQRAWAKDFWSPRPAQEQGAPT